MVKEFIFGFLFLLLGTAKLSGQTQPVKLACWNLLNYPNPSGQAADTALRHPFYRTVVQNMNPDILVTEENTSSMGTVWFLNDVMNARGNRYAKGVFVNGPDSDNEIYFRDSLFDFVSNIAIATDLRDINEFTLVHTATGDTLRIYAVHLKASSGVTNEAQRASEVDSLRKVTNRFLPGKNFVICGDFNIYGSYETAYQKLLQNNPNDDGNFIDPLTLSGTWDSAIYTTYHTQSTRTVSFGGGATGGLDDRFDMILFSTAISQGSAGIFFRAGSTIPVGNDGSHYNQSINTMPNSSVPAPVANALYYASDHLPVSVILDFSMPTGTFAWNDAMTEVAVFPNPVKDKLFIRLPAHRGIASFDIQNAIGSKLIERTFEMPGNEITVDVSGFLPGVYILSITTDKGLRTFKILKN